MATQEPSATATPTGPAPLPADRPGLFGVTSNYVILGLDLEDPGPGEDPSDRERRFHFGRGQSAFAGELPLAGDWDGDGLDEVGLYDRRAGRFQLRERNAAGPADLDFGFGPVGQPPTGDGPSAAPLPLAGDWDGDGRDTIGIYDPSARRFALRNANEEGQADLQFVVEGGTGLPLAGDWDGDGIDTVGFFEPATGIARLLEENAAGAPLQVVDSGLSGGQPVAGDWDGDGRDGLGVYEADSGRFRWRVNLDPDAPEGSSRLGTPAAAWGLIAGRWDLAGPTGEHSGFDWPRAEPAELGMDPGLLGQAYSRAAEVANLHSLLVIRDGRLVAEDYWAGYDATMANCVKSVSKSILSAAYGQAFEAGILSGPEQTVASLLPETFRDPTRPNLEAITLGHLMNMSAGLDWAEPGASLGGMVASEDWPAWVAAQPFVSAPGARWNYSTGLTHVASTILNRASSMSTRETVEQQIFEPLGISATRWDLDPAGVHMGGAEVWLRPRDMGRFGQLYLEGGSLEGRRILDPAWVEASTRPRLPAYGPYDYGGWWWMRDFAGYPVTFAWGYGGQFIFLVPDLDMVVVATSSWFRGAQASTHERVFALLEDFILPAAGRRDRPVTRSLDSLTGGRAPAPGHR